MSDLAIAESAVRTVSLSAAECARWNAKISLFYVTAHSYKTGCTIQIGKPHATIQAALAAAERSEKRRADGQMLFIDSRKPA